MMAYTLNNLYYYYDKLGRLTDQTGAAEDTSALYVYVNNNRRSIESTFEDKNYDYNAAGHLKIDNVIPFDAGALSSSLLKFLGLEILYIENFSFYVHTCAFRPINV